VQSQGVLSQAPQPIRFQTGGMTLGSKEAMSSFLAETLGWLRQQYRTTDPRTVRVYSVATAKRIYELCQRYAPSKYACAGIRDLYLRSYITLDLSDPVVSARYTDECMHLCQQYAELQRTQADKYGNGNLLWYGHIRDPLVEADDVTCYNDVTKFMDMLAFSLTEIYPDWSTVCQHPDDVMWREAHRTCTQITMLYGFKPLLCDAFFDTYRRRYAQRDVFNPSIAPAFANELVLCLRPMRPVTTVAVLHPSSTATAAPAATTTAAAATFTPSVLGWPKSTPNGVQFVSSPNAKFVAVPGAPAAGAVGYKTVGQGTQGAQAAQQTGGTTFITPSIGLLSLLLFACLFP